MYVHRRIPGTLFIRNLVERRSLLFQLVRRDFEQRFVGSAIGWIWGLIHPLVLLLSWVYIFHLSTQVVQGTMVKVQVWYDNEFAYSRRLLDVIERLDF